MILDRQRVPLYVYYHERYLDVVNGVREAEIVEIEHILHPLIVFPVTFSLFTLVSI